MTVSLDEGFARLDFFSWDAFNEAQCLIQQVDFYKEQHGCWPQKVVADQMCGTRKNCGHLKKIGVQFQVKPLGRPSQKAENQRKARHQKRHRRQVWRRKKRFQPRQDQGQIVRHFQKLGGGHFLCHEHQRGDEENAGLALGLMGQSVANGPRRGPLRMLWVAPRPMPSPGGAGRKLDRGQERHTFSADPTYK